MCIAILFILFLLYVCLNVGVEYGAWAGFLAFAGLIGLGCWTSIREKKREDAQKQVGEQWRTMVTDETLESEINKRRKHFDSDKEFIAEARGIFFMEIQPGAKEYSCNLTYEDIVLAKHGKLSRFGGAQHGFSIKEPGYEYGSKETERIIREQHRAVLWVDEQLRKFGTDAELYFSTDNMHYFPASEATETECGNYQWSPTITDGFKFKTRAEAERAIQKRNKQE